jgi:hypothetical protein
MLKKMICVLFTLLVTLTIPTYPQTFVPNLVRLSDDSNPSHILIVKTDGSYLLLMGLDSLRIESFATLNRKGDYLSFEETTPWYRVVVVANIANRTGKVVVNYFNVGTFTIVDRTVD